MTVSKTRVTQYLAFSCKDYVQKVSAEKHSFTYVPASDIYLVYTDNYFTGDSSSINFNSPKARAIVLKINYWFNT